MNKDSDVADGDFGDTAAPYLALESSLLLPCGTLLPNRLVKAATTELLADNHNRATHAHATLYERWSRGGAGLILTGNVQVDYRHLEHPGNVVISGRQDAEHLASLRSWAAAGQRYGSEIWMQLSHAGRQTHRFVNPTPLAPSPVPLKVGIKVDPPVEMTERDILDLIGHFAYAATVARETGFNGVELHAAHGYLFSQFLSPLSNVRSDAWGGDLVGRARFLLETVKAVRAAVGPDFPVAVKLNSADFQRGGFAFEDAQIVGGWLDEARVDVIEISGGTYEQPKATGIEGQEPVFEPHVRSTLQHREAYFAKFAPDMRANLKTAKLMVTGGFRTVAAMAEAVARGGVDLVGMARPLCVDPDAPARILAGHAVDLRQRDLRLGPWLLGPRSRIRMIRTLNAYAAGGWYAKQVLRMAAGLAPDPRLSLPSISRLMRQEKQRAATLVHR